MNHPHSMIKSRRPRNPNLLIPSTYTETMPQDSDCTLLRLPPEIRDQIFSAVFPDSIDLGCGPCPLCFDVEPPISRSGWNADILRTNWQLYEESSAILYKRTFRIEIGPSIAQANAFHDRWLGWHESFPFEKATRIKCQIEILDADLMLDVQRRVVALCRQLRLAERLASVQVEFVSNCEIRATHLRRILHRLARLRNVGYVEIIVPMKSRDYPQVERLVQGCQAAMMAGEAEPSPEWSDSDEDYDPEQEFEFHC